MTRYVRTSSRCLLVSDIRWTSLQPIQNATHSRTVQGGRAGRRVGLHGLRKTDGDRSVVTSLDRTTACLVNIVACRERAALVSSKHSRGCPATSMGIACRLKKPVPTKRGPTVSPISRPSSARGASTVWARNAPSPAVLSVREACVSPVALPLRGYWSPLVMRELPPPQVSAPQIRPSVRSPSCMSFSATSPSPLASPNREHSSLRRS